MIIMTGLISSVPLSAQDELSHYLQQDDGVYQWEVKSSKAVNGGTVYDLLLTSQKWQEIIWQHQLRIAIPAQFRDTHHALIFITGGSNNNSAPNWKSLEEDDELKAIGSIAFQSGSPVAVLRQVPNQPLYGERNEDDLISYTFVQYLETKDKTWPLLFPMVKSAVRAMDAIQEFVQQEFEQRVDKFVVSGASKRGWTTWLTGASEPRVAAIAPMVIDVLNMDVQMDYQLKVWGRYSEEIRDYQETNILALMEEDKGGDLLKMVDPYEYREKITMPKMIFIGTNDAYWPVDAIKHYLDDLKGETYIHYVPNAGHNLGDGKQAVNTLGAFFATVAFGNQHPALEWEFKQNGNGISLQFSSDTEMQKGSIWYATSTDRDFRNEQFKNISFDYSSKCYVKEENLPDDGYIAFYAEGFFPNPIGETYSKCTRMYVVDRNGLVD
jgi:PhoPQ-activated pathogenicity-related protein